MDSLDRQKLCLKAQEQKVISLQWKRVLVGKVKEQMKQLPLEVVRAPKWRLIFASPSAAAEGKCSKTRGVGGDARLCLRTPLDYGGKRGRDGGAEIHTECSQRVAMCLALCDNKACRDCDTRRRQSLHDQPCMQCYSERRLKEGERRVTTSKWREMVEQ